MHKIFICFLAPFLCLNLGKAQVSPAETPTSSPALAPPIPVILTTTTPAISPIPGVLGSLNASSGKYNEYQSICRFNEYDNPSFVTSDEQQKRIDALNEKIKLASNPNSAKIRLLLEYVDQKKNDAAETFYLKLKQEKLSDAEGKIAEAVYSIIRRDFKKAESLLSKVSLNDSKNRDALEYLAKVYKLDLNYFESASAFFDLAKLTKENFDVELCEVLTLDSQHRDAEKTCKKASQKFESNPYPLIYLGISQREQLNYSEARQYFKDSVKRKQTEMGYTCLGEIFYLKENFSGAAELFKWAAKVAPSSSRASLGLAWALFKDKKLNDSLASFKAACKKDKRVVIEIRKAFKVLTEEKSAVAKQFAEAAQKCTESF